MERKNEKKSKRKEMKEKRINEKEEKKDPLPFPSPNSPFLSLPVHRAKERMEGKERKDKRIKKGKK